MAHGLQHRREATVVCFSDGSTGAKSAASVMHETGGGRAGEGNVCARMRCVVRYSASSQFLDKGYCPAYFFKGITPGALELAGIALSLSMLKNYTEALWTGGGLAIALYSDNKAMVEFVSLYVRGAATEAGARHLKGLVEFVRGLLDLLRRGGHDVFIGWASRRTHGLRRADDNARYGLATDDWPPGLLELVSASSLIYFEASPADRAAMSNY